MPLTPSKPCSSAAHYWVLHFDILPERLRGYVDRRAHYLEWIHMQDEAQLGGTVLLVGLAVTFQSGCPASSRDTVTHRHYFEKGLQHRLSRGVDIQSAWKSCTLSSFSDNSCYLYGACRVLHLSSAATPPQTARSHPSAVKLSLTAHMCAVLFNK